MLLDHPVDGIGAVRGALRHAVFVQVDAATVVLMDVGGGDAAASPRRLDLERPGPVRAVAQRADGTLVAGGAEGLLAAGPDASVLEVSPIGGAARLGVVAALAPLQGVLWISSDAGLHALDETGLRRATFHGLELQQAALLAGRQDLFLYVVAGPQLFAITPQPLLAVELTPAAASEPIQALALDGAGTLWTLDGAGLSARGADGRFVAFELPERPTSIAASSEALDLWLGTATGLWHHREGQFRPIEGVSGTLGDARLVALADGGVLVAEPDRLVRVFPGRHVAVEGLEPGARLEVSRSVTLEPTAPETLERLEAAVDGLAQPVESEDGQRRIHLDVDALGDGPHRLSVTAAWRDGETVTTTVPFTVARPPPPPEPDAAPPPEPDAAPPPEPDAAPPPSFGGDVRPVLRAKCDNCHGPRGFAHPLHTYRQVVDDLPRVLTAVQDGRMPLPPNEPLTPAEQTTLVLWRDGGFPE